MNEIPLRVIDLISRELNVHGVRASTRDDQRIVVELLEKGRITMPIYAVLPLSQAAQAHRLLEDGKDLVGRIVLHPWES
jgi:NADPH:quinone reductase-like Zn-dependent oxidoreductase